jgi:hypothetical protein
VAKKKTANLLPKLSETEQDLLSHIQDGYRLKLGGNPVLRRLKDNEEIRHSPPIAIPSRRWNSAAHRLEALAREEAGAAFDVVEAILNFLYDLDYKASQVKKGARINSTQSGSVH